MDSATKRGASDRRAKIRARAAAGGRVIRHESEIPDELAVTAADVVSAPRDLDEGDGVGDVEGEEVVGNLGSSSIGNEEHDVVNDSSSKSLPSESAVTSEYPIVSMI